MKNYSPRKIEFKQLVRLETWTVKVYTISELESEIEDNICKYSIARLHEWLEGEESYDLYHDKIAFLFIHSTDEGVISVVNWWYGLENLNTQIYLSNTKTVIEVQPKFVRIPGDGSDPSDWEMEVIMHERKSWFKHVLNKRKSPDYNSYKSDTYNGYF